MKTGYSVSVVTEKTYRNRIILEREDIIDMVQKRYDRTVPPTAEITVHGHGDGFDIDIKGRNMHRNGEPLVIAWEIVERSTDEETGE